jgi:hypothetical protein
MATQDPKQRILDDAGYAYNYHRRVYYNRQTKKIFSVQFIDAYDEATLESKIREDTGKNGWKFYVRDGEPSEAVKREFEASLG